MKEGEGNQWMAVTLGYIFLPTSITQLPLAFVRSGYILLDDGTGENIGGQLSAWPSTSKSPSNAYYLLSGVTDVYPDTNHYRYYAFPLR